MQNKNCNVLIVGFGPTGAVLANLLSKYDLSIQVLEKESQIYNLPRAVHFDDEIMRIFKSIGIFDKLVKKTIINKGTKFVDEDDNLILDWPRPRQITNNGFYPSYRFHQPDLEKILRKNLALNDNIKIYYNAELTELKNKGKFVKAKYINKVTNTSHIINADYVVGCDGANSFVNTSGGTPFVAITNGNEGTGSGRGPHNAAYLSGTGTNELVFRITIGAANSATNADDVLTIGTNAANLNSGTIRDAGTSTNSDITNSSAIGTAAGSITVSA